jgi:hypothetical protein
LQHLLFPVFAPCCARLLSLLLCGIQCKWKNGLAKVEVIAAGFAGYSRNAVPSKATSTTLARVFFETLPRNCLVIVPARK